MSILFDPSGLLDVATDAADLPQSGDGRNFASDALRRCKNLRINQNGKAVTRDGSAKINTSAIATAIWWIEEMAGARYAFAGTAIYEDESSIETGLTSAQWAAIQYNSFNDSTKQIFALNGTDRKRVVSGSVNEWGLAAPTVKPSLSSGTGSGLSGEYNVRYTWVRKVGSAIVAESNPSDAADDNFVLNNQSLAVDINAPTDSQVTHARLYRTLKGGSEFFLDTEIEVSTSYVYGYSEGFEETDAYIAGDGFKFTTEDTNHSTENTYTWERVFETSDAEDEGSSTPPYIDLDEYRYPDWWQDPGGIIP